MGWFYAEIRRSPFSADHFSGRYLEDGGGASGCHFIQAIGAMHHKRALRLQARQRLGHQLGSFYGWRADQLARGSRGIGERSEKIENGPHLQLQPGWLGVLHGGMKQWREEKSDPDFADGTAYLLRCNEDMNAERFQNVGAAAGARERAVPVLGHAHACTGGYKRCNGGDVERPAAIAASPAGVEQGLGACIYAGAFLAHGPRKAQQLVRG